MPSLDDLPRESLLNIATFLSPKDLLTFMRLNRNYYETILRSRQKLAKPDLTSFCFLRKDDVICIYAKQDKQFSTKDWKIKLIEDSKEQGESKTERQSQVATVYMTKGIRNRQWSTEEVFEEVIVRDLAEALEDHLEFVLTTCHVDRFVVESTNPLDYDIVNKVCRSTCSTFTSIGLQIFESNINNVKSIIRTTTIRDGSFTLHDQASVDSLFSDSTFNKFHTLGLMGGGEVPVKVFDVLNSIEKATQVRIIADNDFSNETYVKLVEELINEKRDIHDIIINIENMTSFLQLAKEHFDVLIEEDPVYPDDDVTYIIPFGEKSHLEILEEIDAECISFITNHFPWIPMAFREDVSDEDYEEMSEDEFY